MPTGREVADTIKEAFELFSEMELPLKEREVTIMHEAALPLIGYIEQLEAAQPKWISVEERLPEDRENYLTVVRCPKGTWVEINNYDHLEERWEHDMGEYSEDVTEYVTHWINLPEPPKEVAND